MPAQSLNWFNNASYIIKYQSQNTSVVFNHSTQVISSFCFQVLQQTPCVSQLHLGTPFSVCIDHTFLFPPTSYYKRTVQTHATNNWHLWCSATPLHTHTFLYILFTFLLILFGLWFVHWFLMLTVYCTIFYYYYFFFFLDSPGDNEMFGISFSPAENSVLTATHLYRN